MVRLTNRQRRERMMEWERIKADKHERKGGWAERKAARKVAWEAEQSAAMLARHRILVRLGFASYKDYLDSDLWADVRTKVLSGERWCRICKHLPPSQVHHTAYDAETLRGDRLDDIIPVCGRCHQRIEFTCCGNKRTFPHAVRVAKSLLSRRDKLGRKPKPPPRRTKTTNWRRSKKGNIYRTVDGRTVTVFFRRGVWGWCIGDFRRKREGGPVWSKTWFASEDAAKRDAEKAAKPTV